ncbi:MAG: aminotransferase class V-fold PLP-dependent enzyme, partial [Proteobacteria bacterium]|nr:aminotransferase class V-fold PLP-dependent enzyme [Pseudomonadota bacterium]
HETSTGQLYDIQSIGKIAREHGVLFIVDGISTICADPFAMDNWNVDVTILSSQKALALPPGLSFVAMNPQTARRLANAKPKSFYWASPEFPDTTLSFL